MAELMNQDDFRTALENAIKGKAATKSPFSVAWASGKLSRAHLARWAENHYHYVGPFADYLAYIYARTPDSLTDAKDFLLANMYEEEIGGDRHTDLLIRFAEACGTTRERVTNPDNMSPTTRGLQSWCYAVAMREDPVVAVAGLVVGLESQVPSIYRKQTPTLREKYKFTDEEVEFFDLHIVSDEIHGERGYQIVLEQATTPELQQRCLKICEVGAQMRLLYTTALFHDYVEAELPLKEIMAEAANSNAEPALAYSIRADRVPKITFRKLGQVHEGEVKENTNLVVRAGIRQFPFPHLRYGCGMGKCSKCACRVIAGAEHLPPPNWKEKKMLRANLERGYRLCCQLWFNHDVELEQDSDEVWEATIKPPEEAADTAAPAPKPANEAT